MISNFKQKVLRLAHHLAFIRTLPCLKCWSPAPSEASHLRAGLPPEKKGGTAYKSCDTCTVPLCHECHARSHRIGEKSFWGDLVKVYDLTQLLFLYTGQKDRCIEAMQRFSK